METNASSAEVYKFTRMPDFLLADYQLRKQKNKTWSYQAWANKLKVKKTVLIRSVQGKRPISEALEDAFCLFFRFDHDAEKYFRMQLAVAKIRNLYPDMTVEIPQIHILRERQLSKTKPDVVRVNVEYLSRPEVQWLIAPFSGAGYPADLNRLREAVHPVLRSLPIETILKPAFDKGLIKVEGGKAVFDIRGVYLDARDTGTDLSTRRSSSVLEWLQQIVAGPLSDWKNLGSVIKIKDSDSYRVRDLVQACFKQISTELADEAGDVIVDIEFFFSTMARLNSESPARSS